MHTERGAECRIDWGACAPGQGHTGWGCPGVQWWSVCNARVSRVPTVPEELRVTAQDALLLGPCTWGMQAGVLGERACARGELQACLGSVHVREVDALGMNGGGRRPDDTSEDGQDKMTYE